MAFEIHFDSTGFGWVTLPINHKVTHKESELMRVLRIVLYENKHKFEEVIKNG